MFRTVGERTGLKGNAGGGGLRQAQPSHRGGLSPKGGLSPRGGLSPIHDWVSKRMPMVGERPAEQRSISLHIDVPLFLLVLPLLIFGLIMVYSASYDYSYKWYENSSKIFERQVLWIILGIGVATVLTFLDYHRLGRWAVIGIMVTIVALGITLFSNQVLNGAVRTLFGGSVQPSELAKLITIIYLAVWLYSKRERLSEIWIGVIPLSTILGIVGALIFLQPDLSATMTVFFLGGMMFFLAGGDLRQIGILLILAVLVGSLVVWISPTGHVRVGDFVNGLRNPMNASYHMLRAFESFVNGKWFGVGIGNGVTKLVGLPVPQTDSIFALIGEETCVFGCMILVAMYVLLLWRGLAISQRAPDGLGMLLAAGLSLWIAMEAFINMSVMMNLLPFAGNALPFISSGGSNLVVSMAGIGILLNISRQSTLRREESEKTIGAVVDLRWRDGRRRVPGPHRPSGPV